ncbi:hypothetical protein BDZ91DRAFT_799831 [Kalaharituber pfeilii]|nr:hypothetical protein BDZ91DRAFT_799831 [Kalaharituber pfeilii]
MRSEKGMWQGFKEKVRLANKPVRNKFMRYRLHIQKEGRKDTGKEEGGKGQRRRRGELDAATDSSPRGLQHRPGDRD